MNRHDLVDDERAWRHRPLFRKRRRAGLRVLLVVLLLAATLAAYLYLDPRPLP